MKILTLFLLYLFIQNINSVTFSEALKDLAILESYIKEYKSGKSISASLNHLVLSYIREGVYTSTEWSIAGGSSPSDLDQYIIDKDAEKNTSARQVRKYREMYLPSGEQIDFVHLFAVMNGIDFGESFTAGYSTLVGWGGDTAELLKDIKDEKGTLDELVEIAKTKYLGIKGAFGPADLISDIDAPIILSKKNDDNTFSEIMQDYYRSKESEDRNNNFIKITFPNVANADLRKEAFNRYSNDMFINVLECKFGVRSSFLGCVLPGNIITQYQNHEKAAVYAFVDYLTSN